MRYIGFALISADVLYIGGPIYRSSSTIDQHHKTYEFVLQKSFRKQKLKMLRLLWILGIDLNFFTLAFNCEHTTQIVQI